MRMIVLTAVAAALLASATPVPAQSTDWSGFDTLETQMFFGLTSADGNGVSEQEWAAFLRDVVTPRFPDGLTVVSAYGQGGASLTGGGPGTETTKLLVIVHPNSDDAARKFQEIKAEYKSRFGQKGVFHVDVPARIVP